MSTKKLIFVLLLLSGLQTVFGQKIEFRPQMGIGTYSMSDLKGILKQSVSSSPLGLKTTENFPAYAFYSLDIINFLSPKFGLGVTSGFYSTGGRNHISDFSGSYREDILVNSVNVGLLASLKGTLASSFFYGVELSSGIKFSNMTLESELNITAHNEKSFYAFRSTGWWIEPNGRFGRTFFNHFTCSLFGGYEFNLKSTLKLRDNSQNSSTAKIDWSGIRTGISFSYQFGY
jgi:hypothetical protein